MSENESVLKVSVLNLNALSEVMSSGEIDLRSEFSCGILLQMKQLEPLNLRKKGANLSDVIFLLRTLICVAKLSLMQIASTFFIVQSTLFPETG